MVNLRRMRYLINTIPDVLWTAERRMASATRLTTAITGMPKNGGGGNRQEDANIAYADAMEAYREVLRELKSMQDELEPMIERLEDHNEKGAMRMRYLMGHKIAEIAEALDCDPKTVYNYLTRAESKIEAKQNG